MTDDLSYRIDPHDRIVHVSETWDEFADANDGENTRAARVLGVPLWTFISDATIHDLYRRLVKIAREGRVTEFRYRCDAPTERRVFRMRIAGDAHGGVTFASRLESATARPALRLLARGAPRSGEVLVRICSWCHCIAWPEASWIPLERAVERFQLFDAAAVPGLTHGICDSCAAQMLRVIKGES